VGDLYLAILSNSVRFAEVRFRLIVQALETYHRDTIGGEILREEDWNCVLGQLCNVVDQQTFQTKKRKAMKGRHKSLNQLPLSFRLLALLRSLDAIGDRIGCGNAEEFSSIVADTRNRVTHWSPAKSKTIVRGASMMHATERLLVLLEILLIRDIGLSMDSAAVADVLRRRVKWLPPQLETEGGQVE
jgi:hypothetical protein